MAANKNVWSAADMAVLVQCYQSHGADYVAEQTGRPVKLVRAKAHRVGLAEPSPGNWSAQELEQLRTHYPVHGADHVAQLTGRLRTAVLSQAKRLGLRSGVPAGRPRWSAEDDALLREAYPTGRPTQELVQTLGRNAAAIHARACLLGVQRPAGRKMAPKPVPAPTAAPTQPTPAAPAAPAPAVVPTPTRNWTTYAEQQLRMHFPDMDNAALAELLGRTEHAVRARATELKLKKSEAFLAARAAALAEARLIKKKAQQQVEQKATKTKAPPKAAAKKWFHYPMGSPEYKAGLAATTAGKQAVTIIDQNGKPATVWRNAA